MADVPNVALRVSQIDAAELDSEIVSLTKTQLAKLFKYQETNFLANFEPEVNAGIKLLLWKFSISARDCTLGQAMLNLKYRNEAGQAVANQWITPTQKILYAWLLIGCPWITHRSHDILSLLRLDQWKTQVQLVIKWMETGFKIATLLNFMVFLKNGAYMYILERILGIRAVFPQKQGMRQVTFEFMTRELLWHGFAEFLFFILPLINFQRIKNFVVTKLLSSGTNSMPTQYAQRDLTSCAVCSNWPIRAQEIGCPHVFCYFCLQSNYTADPGYCCPLCSHKVSDTSNIHTVSVHHETPSSYDDVNN